MIKSDDPIIQIWEQASYTSGLLAGMQKAMEWADHKPVDSFDLQMVLNGVERIREIASQLAQDKTKGGKKQ